MELGKDFNSNETVKFEFGSEHITINTSNGKLSVGTDISGSNFTRANSFISGSVKMIELTVQDFITRTSQDENQ